MQRAQDRAQDRPNDDADVADSLGDAFRQLHGPTLHGFALLLTLGDRPRAARLAADALRAAEPHLAGLRHPERAAAWVRAHVARAGGREAQLDVDERLEALEELGITARVLSGLASLERRERAALIAAWIERLDRRDVATITARDGAALESLLRRARRRYLAGYAAAAPPTEENSALATGGPLVGIVRAAAARALP